LTTPAHSSQTEAYPMASNKSSFADRRNYDICQLIKDDPEMTDNRKPSIFPSV
jgi:hypothetical protein